MCCLRSSRAWYLLIVSLWLLLTIIRQVFDSIGKLWIPIIFNSLQIFSCICGLIAAIQRHMRLLIIVILFNITSILHNIALVLWYNEYFGVNRDVPILSAGLPNSYSFFLRYTPFCKSYYNLTSSRWMQAPCFVPYYYFESAQAVLHIFMAILSVLLSTALLRHRNFSKIHGTKGVAKITKKRLCTDRPVTTVMRYNEQYEQGYLNKSFDMSDREIARVARPENGYVRHSKKPARKIYRQATNTDHHQSTDSLQNQAIVRNSQSMVDLVDEYRKMQLKRTRSVETNNYGLSDTSEWPHTTMTRTARTNSRQVYRTGSLKNFKVPTTEGVRRILSREEISGLVRCRRNDASTRNDGHLPNSNLKSLVSFDPKSNVLLRVQNHVDDDTDDDGTYQVGGAQQERQRRLVKPMSAFDAAEQITSPDSGRPSSSSSASYRPNEHCTSFSTTTGIRSCDPVTFERQNVYDSAKFVQRQPFRHSENGADEMYRGTRQDNLEELEELSAIVHYPESKIISGVPVFNNNSLLV